MLQLKITQIKEDKVKHLLRVEKSRKKRNNFPRESKFFQDFLKLFFRFFYVFFFTGKLVSNIPGFPLKLGIKQ